MADTWPPEPFDIAFARFRELDAWYTGDAQTLAEIYSGQAAAAAPTHTVNGRAYRGGILGSLSKMFVGQPVVPDEKRMRMHLPLAADLCTLSADLLFGEAPQVVFRNPTPDAAPADGEPVTKWTHPAQDRLDEIIGADEAHAELLLAGEYAAALGGSYIAVAWDKELQDHVFPKAYAADSAIPTFRHGRLWSVKLWSEYHDGNEVYRLVEEHQRGTVEFTLYRGTARTLGKPVQIEERPETAHYASLRTPADYDVLDGELPQSVKIATGSDRLAVAYMPNARPVRDWRKLGPLAYLGRSDLDGVQDILDKVDMTWSSLMRDIENGQGRLIMPEEFLTVNGPGQGSTADLYRQVFTPVAGGLGKSTDNSGGITIAQFAIRVQEHLDTINGLKKELASAVGYSESHLGLDDARGERTATDVQADLSDSERTRDKKALYAKAALARWSLAALEIDKAVFGGTDVGDLTSAPDVVFAPVSQADPEKMARTAQLLDAARAATRETIVRTVHPDWDDDEVKVEADGIRDELDQAAMRDPIMSPFDPTDQEKPDDGEEPEDGDED
ncbi:phage portal protein [Agromyces sp. G08B096]|uniref:Phage portal protein n=1 Tax=Agromyces sp. G08B096 TaxID=3156399 RepID=A0AAU7W679_9MICO